MNITGNRKKILFEIESCVNSDEPYAPHADELAEMLGMDRGNVRRTLYQLESARLVERVELESYYSTKSREYVKRKTIGWKLGGVPISSYTNKELTDEQRDALINEMFGRFNK